MGEVHNVVFGQGPKVNKAKSTPTSPSICLMRHKEGEVSVLLALLTFGPCTKNTLCSSPIKHRYINTVNFLPLKEVVSDWLYNRYLRPDHRE